MKKIILITVCVIIYAYGFIRDSKEVKKREKRQSEIDDLNQIYLAAKNVYESQNYNAVIDCLNKIDNIYKLRFSTQEEILIMYAFSYQMTGLIDKAIESFTEAIKRNENYIYYINRSFAKAEKKDILGQIQDLNKSLQLVKFNKIENQIQKELNGKTNEEFIEFHLKIAEIKVKRIHTENQ